MLIRSSFRLGTGMLVLAVVSYFVRVHQIAAHPGMLGAIRVLPASFAGGALFFFTLSTVGGLLRRTQPALCDSAWTTLLRVSAQSPNTRRDWLIVGVACGLLVLALDHDGFRHGFFRLDDFEYLRIAREESPGRQLLATNGGHSMPLIRLEILVLAAGNAPLPWVFNLINFASFVALLVAGCWLLVELGAGWPALLFFVSLNWLWPGWGDFTAGYFCLMLEPQGNALGFAALAALLRASHSGRIRWLTVALVTAGLAAAVDLANAWVLPALAVFAAATFPRPLGFSKLVRTFIFGFVATALVLAAYNFAAFQHVEFLGTAVGNSRAPGKLLQALFSGVGGAILNAVLPVQAGSLNTHGFIFMLEWAVLGLALWPGLRIASRANAPDRRLFLSLVAVMFGQVAMIVIARRPDFAGFFWPPKWTAMVHCTFVLLLALALDRHMRSTPAAHQPALQWTAMVLLVGVWTAVITPPLLDSMGAPVSRANNVRHARLRRADFDRFAILAEQLATKLGGRPVVLPPCDPTRLAEKFPHLEGYTLAHYASALPRDLLRVTASNEPMSPDVRSALVSSSDFRELYPEISLVNDPSPRNAPP